MTRSELQSYWSRIYFIVLVCVCKILLTCEAKKSFQSQTNPSREDELPIEQEGLGEVGGTAQPLEDKPGEGMDELAKESEVMAGGGKKGKKKRKKDDW